MITSGQSGQELSSTFYTMTQPYSLAQLPAIPQRGANPIVIKPYWTAREKKWGRGENQSLRNGNVTGLTQHRLSIAQTLPPLLYPASHSGMHGICAGMVLHMKRIAPAHLQSCLRLLTAVSVVCSIQPPLVQAQSTQSQTTNQAKENLTAARPLKTTTAQGAYILGPGDAVVVELLDVPEYSGVFTIGPAGTLYLPRLRSLYVEGLTVEGLGYLLTQEFSAYVRDPQVFVSPAAYRPIRVYIGGEVARPGYYYLSGTQTSIKSGATDLATGPVGVAGSANSSGIDNNPASQAGPRIGGVKINSALQIPTVFDAIRTAGGVTPFSNLSDVIVTRKLPLSKGGGKIRTSLNFLTLITDGNESQNIRLFDNDTVVVARSPVELREQIIKAGQTNLSPDFLKVFVTGRVRDPGTKILPQGHPLTRPLLPLAVRS